MNSFRRVANSVSPANLVDVNLWCIAAGDKVDFARASRGSVVRSMISH